MRIPISLPLMALSLMAAAASAQVAFDFESATPIQSPLVAGDVANFLPSTAQSFGGSQSLRFDYSVPDAYQSWTYDMPFTVENGQVSVWFNDVLGDNRDFNKFGGSIILEDADAPGNFLAVEIWNAPYPGADSVKNYFLTRGNAAGATTFRSNYFGDRSIGWHQVVFNITPSGSTALVDGIQNASGAGIVTGPGSSSNLRLRFMAWSASDGGFSNWTTDTEPTAGFTITDPYIFLDDLTVTATTPTAQSRTESFEIVSSVASYDTPNVFMGPSASNNPFMKNLVPQWGITTDPANVRTGSQAISFVSADPNFKGITFDLAAATPGSITLKMHDLIGPDSAFDKVGGSILIEQASAPGNFVALEVWNATYPSSGDPTPGAPNYYLTRGFAGNPVTTFRSRYFGNRQTGWNNVEIVLTATESRIVVNGIENSDGVGIVTGPGINDGIRLRLMADSASCGGFTNYTTVTELETLDLIKSAPYLSFDNLVLPVPPSASVADWTSFE